MTQYGPSPTPGIPCISWFRTRNCRPARVGPAELPCPLIDRCAHLAVSIVYVEGDAGHIRHDLTRCFEFHFEFHDLIEHGAMLSRLGLNQFSDATPDESSGAVRRLGGASS